MINQRIAEMTNRFKEMFGEEPTVWVQAPGRVDLMGSHTDYNEGYVLTMTIDRNTIIAAQPRRDHQVAIGSMNVEGCLTFSLDDLRCDPALPWSNFVKWVTAILQAADYALHGFNGL